MVTPSKLPWSKVLQTMLAEATGKPCGLGSAPTLDAVAPSTERLPAPPPFTILYPMPGGLVRAPAWDDAYDEATWIYQVTAVTAKDDRQAIWLLDKVRSAWLDRNPDGTYVRDVSVAGWSATRGWEEDAGRDSDTPIVSYVERYWIRVTPA